MSSREILAGKAYAELSLRDKLSADLQVAQARMLAFGRFAMSWGARLMGGAGAVGAGFLASLSSFSNTGAQLNDMAERSGMAASSFSALSYAAKLTGTDVEAVAKAGTALAKFTLDLSRDGKKSVQVLRELGIAKDAFLAASPERKFQLLADALAEQPNPTLRSALAMKVLGKSASDLVPMLKLGADGLAELIAEGASFGAILNEDEIKKASELDDAWDRLQAAGQGLINRVAIPLADAMTGFVESVADGIGVLSQFLANNQQIVVYGAISVGVVFGLGAALVGLGAAAWLAAAAIGAVTSITAAWTAITAAAAATLAAITSPLGILVGSLLAMVGIVALGAVLWVRYTESGKQAFSVLSAEARGFADTLGTTAGGVFDALMAGDWKLAGDVIGAGLQAGLAQAMASIETLWLGLWNAMETHALEVFKRLATALAPLGNTQWKAVLEQSAVLAGAFQKQSNKEFAKGAADAVAKYANAKAALEKERLKAGRERERADEKWKRTHSSMIGKIEGGDLGSLAGTAATSRTFGTFSGAAALLANQIGGDNAGERTAKATEEMSLKLDEIKVAIESADEATYDD